MDNFVDKDREAFLGSEDKILLELEEIVTVGSGGEEEEEEGKK